MPYFVGAKDVALEIDGRRRVLDELEHRGEGGRPVAQQGDVVPTGDVGRRNPPEAPREGGSWSDWHVANGPIERELSGRRVEW